MATTTTFLMLNFFFLTITLKKSYDSFIQNNNQIQILRSSEKNLTREIIIITGIIIDPP